MGMVITQRKYTLNSLRESRKLGCRPLYAPIEANQRIGIKDGKVLNKEKKMNINAW